MTLSIIIVSYNVREFLEQALLSIQRAAQDLSHEIWVVDNNSLDGSADFVERHFPDVKLIRNAENVGFARANNQAIVLAQGSFICLINPDTVVQEKTFTTLLTFFDKQPLAGAIGCKILNPDGTLQLACRRSFPTPWVAFTKIVGLAALFPKSRFFGRYNLTFLDPEHVTEVEAISGSFMVLRRETIAKVGMLDEAFFMYGEDLDWCYRIKAGGWKIHYVPETQIIHFKGESSKRSPMEQRRLFYEAMRLFVKKHFQKGRAWIPSWALIIAIRLRALLAIITAALKAAAWPTFDLLLLTLVMAASIHIRFAPRFPWQAFILVHLIYSVVWLVSLYTQGVYQRWRFSVAKSAFAIIIGLIVNSAITFFFKDIGFSRLVVFIAGALNLILLPGWRLVLKLIAQFSGRTLENGLGRLVLKRSALLVGDYESCQKILGRLRSRLETTIEIRGIVLPAAKSSESRLENVPVYTGLQRIRELILHEKVDEVIFATDHLPYEQMLEVISNSPHPAVKFRLVPSSMDVMIGKASVEYIDDLPVMEIDYKLHYLTYRMVKRSGDLFLATLLWTVAWPVWLWLVAVRRVPRQKITYCGVQGKPLTLHAFMPPQQDDKKWWRLLPALAAIWRGEMTFVGQRLATTAAARPISGMLKPGLTSLEHLYNDQALSSDDRERYQLYYLKNYSPFLDAEILFKSALRALKH